MLLKNCLTYQTGKENKSFSDLNICSIWASFTERYLPNILIINKNDSGIACEQNLLVKLNRYLGTQPNIKNSHNKSTIYNMLKNHNIENHLEVYLTNKDRFKSRGARTKNSTLDVVKT